MLTFSGLYSYSVAAVSNGTVSCTPQDQSSGLPAIAFIMSESSLLGETSAPAIGQAVLVEFLDADPSKPRIVGADPTVTSSAFDATGTVNLAPSGTVNIGGSSGQPIARQNDVCAIYLPPGSVIPLTGVMAAGPVAGSMTLAAGAVCVGQVTAGSARVKA
jgi:hypothetical protein